MTQTTQLTPADLRQFTGTEQWHRHQLNRKFLHTDGVDYFAKKAGAFWFVDIAALEIYKLHAKKKEGFLSVTMTVIDDSAVIKVTDGDDNSLLTKINYTDCPEGEWKFFQIWDGENSVMLLLSEY